MEVGRRAGRAGRETRQAPGRVGLLDVVGRHDGILLDELDVRVLTQEIERLAIELAREAAEQPAEDVLGLDVRAEAQRAKGVVEPGERAAVLELDDVGVGDARVGVTGAEERRRGAAGGRLGSAERERQQGEED